VFRTALIIFHVLVLGGLGLASALVLYANASVPRVAVQGLSPTTGGQLNVLVVGSDSRDGLTPEELEILGTGTVEGKRTDSIFLLSVEGGAAAMLSFPRDLYLTRCDGSQGRVNGAYATGGPDCLVETISRESGIPVTHYVEVNFIGFVQIVDALGGVEIFLDQPMVDRAAGVNLPAGCNLLDGKAALGFVRARSVDDDLGRIARQQRFLKELARGVAKPSTIADPPRLFNVTGTAARAVTADEDLGLIDLIRLARAARGLATGGLATYTVPANPQRIEGADVLVPAAGADAVFSRFRDGTILDVAPPPDVGLQPGDVTLDVLNGTTVPGLGAEGQRFLTERGFRVDQVGNTEPVGRTVVRHQPGLEPAALLVAAQLPGVTVEASSSGPELALVLGPDADLTAAPPPAPAPAPPADPTTPAGPVVGANPVPAAC
jgi:LCP family protein required for cell wall assembly